MKAVSLTSPKDLKLIDCPMPVCDDASVIVKIAGCGICGSDLHFWKQGSQASQGGGLIMGHEFCGEIADPGNRNDLSPGDRVVVIPLNPCGECEFCESGHENLCVSGSRRDLPGLNAPGAYAEYCKVRSDLVRAVPGTVSDIEAAMIEPAAVAFHAVSKAGILPGHKVLVSGCGPIGLLSAMWAEKAGASQVIATDVLPSRIEFAGKEPYITDVFDAREPDLAKRLKQKTGGFDRVIEASAADAGISLGIKTLKSKGCLVLAGVSYKPQVIPTLLCTLREIEIRTAFGYSIREFETVLDHMASGSLPVKRLVSRTIPLENVPAAFEDLSSNPGNDMKIVITP